MKKIALLTLAASAGILTGCSTAGPYVTNISSNGDGTITVEKAVVEFNSMTGTIQQKNVTTQTLRIVQAEK